MSEQQYTCSKCSKPFPASQIHSHFSKCTGPIPTPSLSPFPPSSPIPQSFPAPQQYPPYAPQAQQYYYPQTQFQPQTFIPPQHNHLWIENDSFKWCADPACSDQKHRALKLKWRGTWFLFVRYGFKLFWIQMLVALAIAAAIFSAYHPIR